MKALLLALFIIALLVGWVWFLGWVIVVVVAWFGPKLAVWQGVVIAFLISALFGGNHVSVS